MKVRISPNSKVWLGVLAMTFALLAAAIFAPTVQKALAASYEPVTSEYHVVDTYEPKLENEADLVIRGISSVSISGSFEWSEGRPLEKRPDSLQVWRIDRDDTSVTRTVCLSSIDLSATSQVKLAVVDDQLVPGKTNYEYSVVAVKESAGELSFCARWENVGGLYYGPTGVRATKITNNKVWVYVDVPSAAVKKTTFVVYSGSKKMKSFTPAKAKTYKFAFNGNKIAKTKFKVSAKYKDNSAAKKLSTPAVKAKTNVWKTSMKASLNDCAAFTHGSRIMKVYYSGGKMYADVWFYNTWNYTTQKNLKQVVKVTVNGKLVSKKVTVKLAKLGPQKSKWKKKICLGKNSVDLVNGGTVAVG